jgi:hypothetical protein
MGKPIELKIGLINIFLKIKFYQGNKTYLYAKDKYEK